MTTTTKTTINTTTKDMKTTIKINNTIRISSMIRITIKGMRRKALKLSKHILIPISWSQDMMLHDSPTSSTRRSQDARLTSISIRWLSCTIMSWSSKIWFTTRRKHTSSQRTQELGKPSRWPKRAKRLPQCSHQPREEQASRRRPIHSRKKLQLTLLNREC